MIEAPVLACRGDREKLQQAWLNITSSTTGSPTKRLLLAATEPDDGAYMDQQCSPGYQGRLCTSCQFGYGSAGDSMLTAHIANKCIAACMHKLMWL